MIEDLVTDDIADLVEAIRRSGLSRSRYATERLARDPNTLYRWLRGEYPIPQQVMEHTRDYLRRAPRR